MISIERRLQLSLAATLTLLMLLLVGVLFISAQRLTEQFALTRLQHDGESLLSALSFDAQGRAHLDPGRSDPIYRQPLSGHYFQIVTDGSVALPSRSLWDRRLEAAHLSPGESNSWHAVGPDSQPLLLWAGGYTKQGHAVTIVVAEDLGPLRKSLTRYAFGFALLTLLLLTGLLLLQRQIVRGSFAPLRRIGRELDQLERGEIEQLDDEVAPELRPLVTELNRLLLLMNQRLQRSRNALGNLAHALKGPLSLLTQLADRESWDSSPALREELREQTDRLRQLIEHELSRARLAGSGSAAQRFTPAEELPPLIELLKRIYPEKGLIIESNYPQRPIPRVDRNDLLELIGNLLDNACKWAEHRVSFTLTDDNGITLRVEDDGPGVSPESLSMLAERGHRIDESLPGHGLGLAIVREIVEIYHGTLELENRHGTTGLCVTARLHPEGPAIPESARGN